MKKFYKIEEFIDTTSNAFALKGTSPLSADATEVTMCSSSDVLEEIEQSFGERSVYIKETDTPFVDFTAMWARWLRRRGDRLAASWEALHTKYKPLENYDRYEDGSDTKAITPAETTTTSRPAETTDTIRPAETTDTTRPAETTTTSRPAETTYESSPAETTTESSPAETTATRTPTITHDQTDSFYAFDASGAIPVNKREDVDVSGDEAEALTVQTAGSDKFTVDTAGSDKLTVDTAGTDVVTVQTAGSDVHTVQTAGSDVHTVQTAGSDVFTVQQSGEEVTEYGHHVYGNIGVTSAMDLIRQEMEIDEKDFVYNAICEFINLYTVYN